MMVNGNSGFILESSWTVSNGKNRLSGMMFSDDSIVVGQTGYEKFLEVAPFDLTKQHEGRFCAIQYRDGFMIAKTDGLGQDLIYYYRDGDQWALSNSFYGLLKFLRSQNVKLTSDLDVLRSFSVEHSSAQQLISNDTAIREIKLLPADRCIRVALTLTPNRFDIVKVSDLSNEGSVGVEEYEETLVNYIARSASVTSTLLSHYPERARVDISGGVDSRLVLAILAASGRDLSHVNFLSNRNAKADFSVATKLGRAVGFSIKNAPIALRKTNSSQSYELWKLGNLATYLPVYAPIGDSPQDVIHFHGACGECFREFYSMSGANMAGHFLRRYPSNEIGSAFQRKLAKSFSDMAIDIESGDSMMAHYRHFRSRLHFGRGAYRNLNSLLVTPLASLDLVKATRHLSKRERTLSRLALDIMLLACPKLASIEFDVPEKAFSGECFESSPFKANTPDISSLMRDMKVYGPTPLANTEEPIEGKSFKERILDDVETLAKPAFELGLFSVDSIHDAKRQIIDGSRLTVDAIAASRIISAGEIALATL